MDEQSIKFHLSHEIMSGLCHSLVDLFDDDAGVAWLFSFLSSIEFLVTRFYSNILSVVRVT